MLGIYKIESPSGNFYIGRKRNWEEKDEERKYNAKQAATKSRSKQVRRLSDGAVFPSAAAASRSVGGYVKMISEAICKNVEKAGSRWEYV
jgi:hypothetical protein